MVKFILFPFINCRWSCSHQAHIAFQDVPELWELIQGCLTDKVSDSFWITVFIFLLAADDSWIVVHLEHQAFHLVLAHQFCFSLFGIHVHAAEFIDFELLSVLADTHLREENRSRGFDVDHRSYDNDQDHSKQAADNSSGNIHQPLVEQLFR